jgi:hypothetical protein
MKKCSNLWQYLADFFSKSNIFHIKVVEKIKTRILCSNTFSSLKLVPFMKSCQKCWWSQRDRRWHCNTAHALCILSRLQTRSRTRTTNAPSPTTHTHVRTHAHRCMHAPTCANTHTQKHVIHLAFPRQQWLHERASLSQQYVHSTYCCDNLQSTENTRL